MNSSVIALPDEVLDNILSYVPYDEISRMRLVSKGFDAACQRVLNQGFYKVEKFHSRCLRRVKEQLPRRESERRKHPLAAHCDILTAIETRLSLLGMTFMKYVDLKFCCFIPGKVLDEIFKILRYITNAPTPPRSHEILQELRDISSMAMEHFDEKIAPAFRTRKSSTPKLSISSNGALAVLEARFNKCDYMVTKNWRSDENTSEIPYSTPNSSGATTGSPTFRLPSTTNELVRINLGYRQMQSKYVELRKENIDCRRRLMDYRKKLHELDRKVSEQSTFILEQSNRISEQDGKISELSRKFMEFDRNMADTIIDLKHEQETSTEDDNVDGGNNIHFDVPPPPAQKDLKTPQSKPKNKTSPANQNAKTPPTNQNRKSPLLPGAATPSPAVKEGKTMEVVPPKRRGEPIAEPKRKRQK